MFTQSRREFLGSLGVFALSLKYVEPQLVLYNGNVITVDSRTPRAQAVAIADGRFTAVGTNAEIRPLATARTVKINLEGKTVLPGFIDAHSHPAYSGLTHLREVDADLRSIHRNSSGDPQEGGGNPSGRVGARLQVRRYQNARGAATHPAGSGRGGSQPPSANLSGGSPLPGVVIPRA